MRFSDFILKISTRKADRVGEREREEEAVEGVQKAAPVSLLPVLLLVTQQRVLVVAVGPRRVGVGREGVRVAVERLSLEVPSQQSLRVRMVVVHKHHCCNKRSPPCSLNTLFSRFKAISFVRILHLTSPCFHSFLANLYFTIR